MAAHDHLLDAQAAAEYLRINVQTVRRLARSGELPAFKVGGSWRFSKRRLDRWADGLGNSPRKAHVLVVDDDSNVLEILRCFLEEEGFSISTASNGVEALRMFQLRVPDLIFLDLVMPDMDGPSLLKEIHRFDSSIPVIVLTGYPDSDLVYKALQISPITLLSKPADQGAIVETVKWTVRAALNRRGVALSENVARNENHPDFDSREVVM